MSVYMKLLVVICLTLILSHVVVHSARVRRSDPPTMTDQQKAEIVNKHNILRAQEGAADMEYLTWNESLAAAAAVTAKTCFYKHHTPSLSSANSSEPFHRYGQNIYGISGDTIVMTDAVERWYDEKSQYEYKTGKCSPGKTCGDYTQLVWATTRQIGCSYKRCQQLEGFKSYNATSIYLVCNYIPTGNVNNMKPFKKGAACTKCSTAWCKEGLCNSQCSKAEAGCTCKAVCYNCGKLDMGTCRCACGPGWTGGDCSQQCEDTQEYCGGRPGWNSNWCLDHTHTYVRRSCPVLCGFCLPDTDAVAGKCPPVYGSKQPDSTVDAGGPNRKSPSSTDDEDEQPADDNDLGKANGVQTHQRHATVISLVVVATLALLL